MIAQAAGTLPAGWPPVAPERAGLEGNPERAGLGREGRRADAPAAPELLPAGAGRRPYFLAFLIFTYFSTQADSAV